MSIDWPREIIRYFIDNGQRKPPKLSYMWATLQKETGCPFGSKLMRECLKARLEDLDYPEITINNRAHLLFILDLSVNYVLQKKFKESGHLKLDNQNRIVSFISDDGLCRLDKNFYVKQKKKTGPKRVSKLPKLLDKRTTMITDWPREAIRYFIETKQKKPYSRTYMWILFQRENGCMSTLGNMTKCIKTRLEDLDYPEVTINDRAHLLFILDLSVNDVLQEKFKESGNLELNKQNRIVSFISNDGLCKLDKHFCLKKRKKVKVPAKVSKTQRFLEKKALQIASGLQAPNVNHDSIDQVLEAMLMKQEDYPNEYDNLMNPRNFYDDPSPERDQMEDQKPDVMVPLVEIKQEVVEAEVGIPGEDQMEDGAEYVEPPLEDAPLDDPPTIYAFLQHLRTFTISMESECLTWLIKTIETSMTTFEILSSTVSIDNFLQISSCLLFLPLADTQSLRREKTDLKEYLQFLHHTVIYLNSKRLRVYQRQVKEEIEKAGDKEISMMTVANGLYSLILAAEATNC